MGTRHLIAVYLDGEYKVAQYGQWDGYPSGVGVGVLEFAHAISDSYYRFEFRERVKKCRWITQDEIDEINKKIENGEIKDWTTVWPELSRNTSKKILRLIGESENGMVLINSIDFAADSLFCEWAYVIDLDKNTFEVFSGFNHTPLTEDDRFYFLRDKEEKNGYHGIRLVRSYSLNDLPTRKEFLDELDTEDE